MDLHPYGMGSLGENPVQFSGRVTAAPLASCPPWRHRLLRPNSALALLVTTAHGRPLSVVASSGLVQVGELHRGRKARAVAFAPLVAVRGFLTSSIWLLAADLGGWRCLAAVSAVRDNVRRRRLRHRHRATTWLAADCGGWLSSAGLLRCDSSSEDGASDYLGLLAGRHESFARVEQRGDVGLRLEHGCSLEALGSGATLPIS